MSDLVIKDKLQALVDEAYRLLRDQKGYWREARNLYKTNTYYNTIVHIIISHIYNIPNIVPSVPDITGKYISEEISNLIRRYDTQVKAVVTDAVLYNIGYLLVVYDEREGNIKLKRVTPHRVLVDPLAEVIDDIKWYGVMYVMSEVEFKELYGDDSVLGESIDIVSEDEQGERRATIDSGIEMMDIYDVVEGIRITCVVKDVEIQKVVRIVEVPSVPIIPLTMRIYPGHVYGIPDACVYKNDLINIQKIEQRISEYTQLCRPVIVYDTSSLQKQEIDRMARSQELSFVGINLQHRQVPDVISPLTYPPLPAEVVHFYSLLKEKINSDFGVTEYMRGAVDTRASTATEAMILSNSASTRASAMAEQVHIFIDKLVRLLKVVIGITKAPLNYQGEEITYEGIKRSELLVTNKSLIARQQRIGDLMQYVQLVGDNPYVDKSKVAKMVIDVLGLGEFFNTGTQ